MIDLTKLPPAPRELTKVQTTYYEGMASHWRREINGEEIHAIIVCGDAASLTKFLAKMGNDSANIDTAKFRMVEVRGK